ncbi:MAG TPA: hypothetical protein VFX16_26680 [Pseudonocardiaceae bacterium]|nr:hypothetical protein [Pseudonocardiaceae bacterium]
MTGPDGFADAVHQFTSELDAAVVRARRVAAAARETSAKFRRETRQLAEQVKAGKTSASPEQRTDERMLRTAGGFRADNGLPVRDLPVPEQPTTQGPIRTTGSGRSIPRPSDDDEDFSQEQIMR